MYDKSIFSPFHSLLKDERGFLSSSMHDERTYVHIYVRVRRYDVRRATLLLL